MEEKRVTPAEAYFDLVFVFAVTQVSGLLHHRHGWGELARAAVVFVPVYWCWVGTTIQANIRDVDNLRDRLGIFAVGLGGLFMALAIPGADGGRGVLFGAAYWGARLVLLGLITTGPDRVTKVWLGPYGVGAFISGPLLLTGGLLPPSLLDGWARTVVWAVAALCDLSAPVVFRARLAQVSYHPAHLPERFGLFLLIALGESIVGIGAPVAATHLGTAELVSVATAFVISCELWWLYFNYAADAMRHATETSPSRRDVIRRVFSYGHFALIAGVIAVAVGFGETVSHPDEALAAGPLGLLYGGCSLYLTAFSYTRWMMFRMVAVTRITATVAVLALLPLMVHLPALGALAALAVVLGVLNAVEYRRVNRARALNEAAGTR